MNGVLSFGLMYLVSCVEGTQGEKGDPGAQGIQGEIGESGASGNDGANGQDGSDGSDALISTEEEPAGDNCEHGGTVVSYGTDTNSDGVLNDAEIAGVEYICNGEAGEIGQDGASGNDGADGQDGADGNDGTNGEDGLNSLMNITAEPAGPNCYTGGVRIDWGLDDNNNGALDYDEPNTEDNESEIDGTEYMCNAATEGDAFAYSYHDICGENGADIAQHYDNADVGIYSESTGVAQDTTGSTQSCFDYHLDAALDTNLIVAQDSNLGPSEEEIQEHISLHCSHIGLLDEPSAMCADSDSDGVLNYVDSCQNTPTEVQEEDNQDEDGDGCKAYEDADDDGDGLCDNDNTVATSDDSDCDGIDNSVDLDADGDGFCDSNTDYEIATDENCDGVLDNGGEETPIESNYAGMSTGVEYDFGGGIIVSWSTPSVESLINAEVTMNSSTFAAAATPGDIIVVENASVQRYNSYHTINAWQTIQGPATLILAVKSITDADHLETIMCLSQLIDGNSAYILNRDMMDFFDNNTNPGDIPADAVAVYSDDFNANGTTGSQQLLGGQATLYKMFTSDIQSALDTATSVENPSSGIDDLYGEFTLLP